MFIPPRLEELSYVCYQFKLIISFYKLLRLQNKIVKDEIMEKVKRKKKWNIFSKFEGMLILTLRNLHDFKCVFNKAN